jgi:hypothetical protein
VRTQVAALLPFVGQSPFFFFFFCRSDLILHLHSFGGTSLRARTRTERRTPARRPCGAP